MIKKLLLGLAVVAVAGAGIAFAQQTAIKRTPLQKLDFPAGYNTVTAIAETGDLYDRDGRVPRLRSILALDSLSAVIGGADVYGAGTQLGRYGIAEEKYENEYIAPLIQQGLAAGRPSVTFHGRMGTERSLVLRQALIGIPNPIGATETFCLSATELSAYGIAVVSGAYHGLLDTVVHGQTGLLGRTEADLVKNICSLLADPKLAQTLGRGGRNFVHASFSPKVIIPLWVDLFAAIKSAMRPQRYSLKSNLHRHYKWLVLLNTPVQRALGGWVTWPSIAEIKREALRRVR